jgi:hypothetical protein
MILPIQNRDNFIKSFLNPISRLATNCTLTVQDEKLEEISTVVHNNSNIFLKASYQIKNSSSEGCLLCLPDTVKLIKILSCLNEDDFNLTYENNCITYNSGKGSKFRYHLFDDSLSLKSPFDFDRIKKIENWSEFTLTRESNNTILKALPFVTENSKIYLSSQNKEVHAELTDKKLQNVDSYTTTIGTNFTGESIPGELILDAELFRLISTLNFDECKVYINNEFKMLKLNIIIDGCDLTFVSTSFKS